MISLLRRFFDDIHRLANCASFPRTQDVVVTLCTDDRDDILEALTKFRRYKPRVKSGDAA